MDAPTSPGMKSQDLIAAFNECKSPKKAAQLFGSLQDSSFNKALAARTVVQGNLIQVCCTTLAGAVKEEYSFPSDASVDQLADKLQLKLSADDVPLTALHFLDGDGDVVDRSDRLADHRELVVKASLSPDDVGKILYQAGDAVSVEFLGQCLGNHDNFWKELAVGFAKNFDCFAGMGIVQAIRKYLWHFRLPGEAAQIERIIDGFARSYYDYNDTDEIEDVGMAGDSDSDSTTANGSESDEDSKEARRTRSCWDRGVSGWYVHQPFTGPKQLPCCIHCGALDGENGSLEACHGCEVVHFCRRCRRSASRYGHAVVGVIGYGRACVAARSNVGSLGPGCTITYTQNNRKETSVVPTKSLNWTPRSPFKDQDAVMVLAYAIIMLATDLHSANVKNKMKRHEFIKQNRDVNGGGNFPGDFLSKVYDDILSEPLGVRLVG